jgi:hypothetical protein
MPMTVTAMIAAPMSQPTAIQRPPKTIHKRLSTREKGDMKLLEAPATMPADVTVRLTRDLSTRPVVRQPVSVGFATAWSVP